MALTARNIADIEKTFPNGMSSKDILGTLDKHGAGLSEATLRKYVQLGLLPRSRRVGEKGKHRGSKGIYPTDVIRRVDEIRRALGDGQTLESLASAAQAVRARLSAVRVAVDETVEAADQDLKTSELDRGAKAKLKSDLKDLEKKAKDWIKAMDAWTVAAAPPKGDGKAKRARGAATATGKKATTKKASKRARRGGA